MIKIVLIVLLFCSTAYAEVPEWYHYEKSWEAYSWWDFGKLNDWMHSVEERLEKLENTQDIYVDPHNKPNFMNIPNYSTVLTPCVHPIAGGPCENE